MNEGVGCPVSPGIQAHSTRGVETSVAILRALTEIFVPNLLDLCNLNAYRISIHLHYIIRIKQNI